MSGYPQASAVESILAKRCMHTPGRILRYTKYGLWTRQIVIYINIHINIVWIYVCVWIYIYMCVYIYVCMYIYMCVCVCVCVCSEVAQSCLTPCDPMDCSPPGSSVHGIFQARVLEWIAISFSRGSSWPRGRTWVSCITGWCFTIWATRDISLYI